jgi:hypothetical protein
MIMVRSNSGDELRGHGIPGQNSGDTILNRNSGDTILNRIPRLWLLLDFCAYVQYMFYRV